jgi:hypothetical protein
VEDIDFLVDFVAGNSNKLQKLGLEGKISSALNVFTLGPMAQATLVGIRKKRFTFHMKVFNPVLCAYQTQECTSVGGGSLNF